MTASIVFYCNSIGDTSYEVAKKNLICTKKVILPQTFSECAQKLREKFKLQRKKDYQIFYFGEDRKECITVTDQEEEYIDLKQERQFFIKETNEKVCAMDSLEKVQRSMSSMSSMNDLAEMKQHINQEMYERCKEMHQKMKEELKQFREEVIKSMKSQCLQLQKSISKDRTKLGKEEFFKKYNRQLTAEDQTIFENNITQLLKDFPTKFNHNRVEAAEWIRSKHFQSEKKYSKKIFPEIRNS